MVYTIIMHLGLVQLFEAITGEAEDTLASDTLPSGIDRLNARNDSQGELFGGSDTGEPDFIEYSYNETDMAIAVEMHAETGIDFSVLKPEILSFFELSRDAFGAIVYAWMSELPITGQIIRFGKKILASQNTVAIKPPQRGKVEAARRKAAQIAAIDRGDFDVQTVREAAYKVWHETNRLMGFLRFCPDEKGVYIAQCEPDHFVLPCLGPHFMKRFGETPWTIIDSKRRLSLCCEKGQTGGTLVFSANAGNVFEKEQAGEWENLWKHYHKTINNESRNNPGLQKRFMPTRYWKYLTEL